MATGTTSKISNKVFSAGSLSTYVNSTTISKDEFWILGKRVYDDAMLGYKTSCAEEVAMSKAVDLIKSKAEEFYGRVDVQRSTESGERTYNICVPVEAGSEDSYKLIDWIYNNIPPEIRHRFYVISGLDV